MFNPATLIFSLFLEAVYPVGLTEVLCVKSLITPQILTRFTPKMDTGIRLYTQM